MIWNRNTTLKYEAKIMAPSNLSHTVVAEGDTEKECYDALVEYMHTDMDSDIQSIGLYEITISYERGDSSYGDTSDVDDVMCVYWWDRKDGLPEWAAKPSWWDDEDNE